MSSTHSPATLLSAAITRAGSRLLRSGRLMRTPIWIYPRAWRRFKPVLESTLGIPIEAEHTQLPMVELRLTPR
ncbi:hypothetical protein [Pseudonocardia sp. GCM10023141]|uniref:hypothetical protein n=1 Tax=Pseudonocardia sp. GCM10023141 TaxID=3252653 RepID=UPI0036096E1C